MSAEQDQARELAERIARRLASSGGEGASRGGESGGNSTGDLAALRAGLADIQRRLTHIESHLGHGESRGTDARAAVPGHENEARGASSAGVPRLSGTYVPAAHPSQERFQLDEAVSEIVDYFEREKVCTVEPGGKPCDHCAMCSSRGF